MGDDAAFDAAIADAFPGSWIGQGGGGDGDTMITMQQHGLLRPLRASELSDGTLRYVMLCAALLTPRKPEILVLNEPEASLHPSLLDPLARLLAKAAETCQIVLVSHSERLVAAFDAGGIARAVRLEKDCGETAAHDSDDGYFKWNWPAR